MNALTEIVDVVVLHRPGLPPSKRVIQAILGQRNVRVNLHLMVGAAEPGDLNRWATIARARNSAKRFAKAAWFMFVDDDVLLDLDCAATLLRELKSTESLGAIAADYSNDRARPDRAGHVAMGATLFRRDVLRRLQFRSTDKLCECWCACLDLRYNKVHIQYSDAARATHLRESTQTKPSEPALTVHAENPSSQTSATEFPAPQIFAAFDRRDIIRFEHQFLRTLRASGNNQTVAAVGYGLYPSERRRLEALPNVRPDWKNYNGQMPPVRRMADFARLLESVPSRTPVAYWDVADVIFQDSLNELWQEVRATPDRLLAVIEPKSYPQNKIIPAWSLTIRHPHYRHQAFELLKRSPFLNSGFAAGTAEVMLRYFQRAVAMRNGPELSGTSDWGDQMCLNMYCHTNPDRWRPVDQRWNFCVHDRLPGEIRVTPNGIIESRKGTKISVAHGNARSLRQFGLLVAK
jgi:hypothetical protein